MKSYLAVTGSIFAAVTVAHVARMVSERALATDPFYLALTGLAAILALWALRLLFARRG